MLTWQEQQGTGSCWIDVSLVVYATDTRFQHARWTSFVRSAMHYALPWLHGPKLRDFAHPEHAAHCAAKEFVLADLC